MLRKNNIAVKDDNSTVAIGRKYVRLDEIGVNCVITVDYEEGVTIR